MREASQPLSAGTRPRYDDDTRRTDPLLEAAAILPPLRLIIAEGELLMCHIVCYRCCLIHRCTKRMDRLVAIRRGGAPRVCLAEDEPIEGSRRRRGMDGRVKSERLVFLPVLSAILHRHCQVGFPFLRHTQPACLCTFVIKPAGWRAYTHTSSPTQERLSSPLDGFGLLQLCL